MGDGADTCVLIDWDLQIAEFGMKAKEKNMERGPIIAGRFAPAIKEGSGMENAIHIHLVSRVRKPGAASTIWPWERAWPFGCRSRDRPM